MKLLFLESLTHLLPATVDIFLAWTKITERYTPDILSKSEKAEWDRFESVSRRREYLATRGLIHEMLQPKWEPEAFALEKDELGKPYGLYDGTEVHLSIAHTLDYVLCGICESHSIGVDLEPIDRTVPERLRDRIINKKERDLLYALPAIRIWTIKEALVKLLGQGMRTNLRECIIFSFDGNLLKAKFNNEKTAKICSFRHQKNWLAVAWNCK